VVCLQETTPEWEALLRQRLNTRYGQMIFRHVPGGAGGMAVLSKRPMKEMAEIEPARGGWFASFIVEVETAAGPMRCCNVHLRPKLNDRGSMTVSSYLSSDGIHQNEMRQILARAEPATPTIVLGDFNEGDGGGALGVLRERGYVDAVRQHDGSTATWRWDVGPVTVRHRLDHIVHSREMKCVWAGVMLRGQSDHLPVVAVFDIASGEKELQGHGGTEAGSKTGDRSANQVNRSKPMISTVGNECDPQISNGALRLCASVAPSFNEGDAE
jgi:endonuclease/exonuclease/phosphatase family metal-dependent hydrolase